MFDAADNYELSSLNQAMAEIQQLSVNPLELHSEKSGLNVLQAVIARCKEVSNDHINNDWYDQIDYYMLVRRDRIRSASMERCEDARTAIVKGLKIGVAEYIMAGVLADTPFVLLAGTENTTCVELVKNLIATATPEQLVKLKSLAPVALHAAVTEGSAETIAIIIQRLGVDPNLLLANGDTFLHLLCDKYKCNKPSASGYNDDNGYRDDGIYEKKITVLLENGADPTLVNKSGQEPSTGYGSNNHIEELLAKYRLRANQQKMFPLFYAEKQALRFNAPDNVPDDANKQIAEFVGIIKPATNAASATDNATKKPSPSA